MKTLSLLLLILATDTALAQTPPARAPVPPQTNEAQPHAQEVPATAQWIRATHDNGFPPPPQAQSAPPAQPVPQSGLTPATYSGGSQGSVSQNGIASLPPLAPPTNLSQAEALVTPFTPSEIIQLRKQLEQTRQAKAFKPVRAVPHIGSISLDLSPGGALPIVRTMPGEVSTLLFVDATGAPWPLSAPPRVSDVRAFDPEWLKGTATVVISALSAYEDGNLVVMLQGFATPIVIKLVSGEPDARNKSRTVDYRLDLRVPGRGPNAKTALLGPGKIALYDDTMQQFLDGLPPKDAKQLAPRGEAPARTQVWQFDGALYVRTMHDIQTAFDQTIASGDGTRVYRLPPTPYITLSDADRSITFQLDID
jgi:intracellular multiplication protein IcmK